MLSGDGPTTRSCKAIGIDDEEEEEEEEDRRALQHIPCKRWNNYTAVSRSPGPRYLGQVAPQAGEDGVWVRAVTECTSLGLEDTE